MRIGPSTRLALVAEELSAHPDEGALRSLERLCRFLRERCQLHAFHARGDAPAGVAASRVDFTRRGVSAPLRRALGEFSPELTFYAPSASITANAMWRARRLRAVTGSPVVLFGFQRRTYGPVARALLGFLQPDLLVVPSNDVAAEFVGRGWPVRTFQLGVDLERFAPVDEDTRQRIREGFGWSPDRRVILHVGHLRRRRGVDRLRELARDPRNRVVMVASVSEVGEEQLLGQLEADGMEVHREYRPDIETFYQGADAYVFPVTHATSAIELPLSVLEALACDLPVATTRFGALPDHFEGNGGLRFVGPDETFQAALDELLAQETRPRQLVEPFGWEPAIEDLVRGIEETLP